MILSHEIGAEDHVLRHSPYPKEAYNSDSFTTTTCVQPPPSAQGSAKILCMLLS